MKNQKTITRTALQEKLINWRKEFAFTGVNFASVLYFTEESGSKTVNKQKLLYKLVRTNITIGSDYETKVNKIWGKQGTEGEFEAQELIGKNRKWGYDVPLCVANKDESKVMLVMIVEHHSKPQTKYFYNNNEKWTKIDKQEAIKRQMFTNSYFEKKTTGRGSVEVERDFYFRTLYLEKILRLNINGTNYKVID